MLAQSQPFMETFEANPKTQAAGVHREKAALSSGGKCCPAKRSGRTQPEQLGKRRDGNWTRSSMPSLKSKSADQQGAGVQKWVRVSLLLAFKAV